MLQRACLKFTVKKPSIDGLIDVLREIQTEIESFHSMLEASVMARALVDLRKKTHSDQMTARSVVLSTTHRTSY